MAGGIPISLDEVARLVGGRLLGDGSRLVSRIAPLDEAGPDDLSFLAQAKYRREAERSSAGAFLVRKGLEMAGRDQTVVDDPHLALTILLPRFHPAPSREEGISPQARIAGSARVGVGAAISPFAVLEPECRVGARSRIGPGCYIGHGSEIGEDTLLHPNTTVYHGCILGDRVVVHAGTVIGSDGFGYATKDSVHHKVPQVGGVVIEDDVEIGASVTIDRGSLGTTRIGKGTKIDNLVQIAHNVQIGPGCLIVAQAGVSGSTRVGAGTILAGQSGIAGHLSVGANSVVASKTAVYEDLPEGARVAGVPAIDIRRWRKAQAVYKQLPELRARVRALELGGRLVRPPKSRPVRAPKRGK